MRVFTRTQTRASVHENPFGLGASIERIVKPGNEAAAEPVVATVTLALKVNLYAHNLYRPSVQQHSILIFMYTTNNCFIARHI